MTKVVAFSRAAFFVASSFLPSAFDYSRFSAGQFFLAILCRVFVRAGLPRDMLS